LTFDLLDPKSNPGQRASVFLTAFSFALLGFLLQLLQFSFDIPKYPKENPAIRLQEILEDVFFTGWMSFLLPKHQSREGIFKPFRRIGNLYVYVYNFHM